MRKIFRRAAIATALGGSLLLGACSTGNDTGNEAGNQAENKNATAEKDCDVKEAAMAIRWQQQSAEAKALQLQTYKFATQRLEELVSKAKAEGKKNLAIATDLDETAIDNSELLARDLENCHDFSEWDTWDQWEKEGNDAVRLIPGALDFFNRANELGVTIFYVSDRTEENHDQAVKLLQKLKFPQAKDQQVMLLGDPKQDRRDRIEKDHELLMQLGDTMHDFDGRFAEENVEQQTKDVEANKDRIGTEWIVLPNPTYGKWEDEDLDAWGAPLKADD